MIELKNKSECCGCWACYNICPKHCIKMVEDNEGFHYPVIDSNECIDCGLCNKVCPIQKSQMDNKIPESYVIQHKDDEVRRNSTSGGFFTAISQWAINEGGVVFGAAFNNDMVLSHTYSETIEGCAKFRGSKYVQSLINDTFSQARKFLTEGRLVVFSGTPCQIAGLYGFLGKKYENLISVDLVCHGTPSPRLFSKYIAYHETIAGSKIISYLSRDKYFGYDYSTATIKYEDNSKTYHKGKDSDLMLRFYFADICSRPSCYKCHFKTLERVSDITIFDCWSASSVSNLFDKNGATNVFIHTSKGLNVFSKLHVNLTIAKSDINSCIKRDGVMIHNHVSENPQRTAFFNDLNIKSLDELERIYLKRSFVRKVLSNIKPIMYKLGLFSMYMKLKNKLFS